MFVRDPEKKKKGNDVEELFKNDWRWVVCVNEIFLYDPIHHVLLDSDTEGLLGLVCWYLRYNSEQRKSVMFQEGDAQTKVKKSAAVKNPSTADTSKSSLEHEHMKWL